MIASDTAEADTLDQDSDYDGAWKEALSLHLPEFLSEYFPSIFAAIDWTFPVEWLDKEISQVVSLIGQRNRVVDLLAKAVLLDGGEQWILLHVEVQTSAEEGFAFRLACYNGSLMGLHKRRVVTLAILADLRDNWFPNEDSFSLGNFSSKMQFPVCKLIHRLRNDWQEKLSLPVQLARAQIATLRTAGKPEERYQAKSKLVKELYRAGYTADQLRNVFRLIVWMVRLRRDLDTRFDVELIEFEKEQQMPYVTSVERVAEVRGVVRTIARILAKVGVELPIELRDRIQLLPVETLDELADVSRDLASVDEVVEWLEQHRA